jgi:hypothetical protein
MTDFHGYPIRAVGITWFREEDYPALLQIFTDADKMPRAWKDWLKGAEKMEQDMKAQGFLTERVYIDPDTFPDWCAKEGTTIDRKGRNKFAAAFVAEKYRTRG